MKESFIKCYENYLQSICQNELLDLKKYIDNDLYENIYKSLLLKTSEILTRILLNEYKNKQEMNDNDFSDQIVNNEYIYYLDKKYVLLRELLSTIIKDNIKYILTIYDNFNKEKKEVLKLCHADNGRITNIITNLGDLHNGVSTAKIEIDGNKFVYYKARSGGNEKLFYALLDYINKDIKLNIKRAKIFDCNSHMWMEEIEYQTCNSINEVKQYYYISGLYLFLFYILTSFDMHYENIINNGSTPVLIDLETLTLLSNGEQDEEKKNIVNSVLNTMFLPYVNENGPFDINLSGILSKTSITHKADAYEINLDNGIELKQKDNIVEIKCITLNGREITDKDISLNDIRKQILSGFTDAGELVIKSKGDFLKLVKSLMKNTPIKYRQILRPTQVYASFLNACQNPESLMSIKSRDKILMILMDNFKPSDHGYIRVENELEMLKKGNVPEYYAIYDSNDLYSNNYIVCKNYFKETIYQKTKEKIISLNWDQLNYQKRLIDYSLISMIKKEEFGKTKVTGDINQRLIDENYVKKEVGKFLDDLMKLEIKYQNGMSTFVAPTLYSGKRENVFNITNINKGLYEYIGVVPLAAYYGYIFNDDSYINYAIRILDGYQLLPLANNLSVFTGEGGYMFICLVMYKLLNKIPQFKDKAKEFLIRYNDISDYILNTILSSELNNESFDFVNGVLSSFFVICNEFSNEKKNKDKILQVFKKIISYNGDFPNEIGLAHGLTGVSLILSSLYKITKDEKVLNLIKALLVKENELLKREENNINCTWCRGIGGILLGRYYIMKNTGYKEKLISHFLKNERKDIIDQFFKVDNLCLCHGVYGNIDILLELGLKDEFNNRIFEKRFENFENLDWFDGNLNCQLDHFMLGNSGIAYELLRILYDNVPSLINLKI